MVWLVDLEKKGRRNWRTISYSLGFGIEWVLLIII